MNLAGWRERIHIANARHTTKLERGLEREFLRLRDAVDVTRPWALQRDVIYAHERRVALIIAENMRRTALTFGFLTLEMIDTPGEEAKAGEEKPPTRAERIAAVLRELALVVSEGRTIANTARALAAERQLVTAIEVALLANPQATARETAELVMHFPRAQILIANAQAAAAEADIVAVQAAAVSPPRPPPTPPPSPPGGGGKPPPPPPQPPRQPPPARPRSRFSRLVERIVREHAPIRARRIASLSGRTIAAVLEEAARSGWGEARTARELRRVLGPEVSRIAAARIARTELGAAQNGAALAVAEDREQATGEPLEKGWAGIDDHRRRPTHAEAEGQWRPLAQPFTVGKALLLYPGDPTGPLDEIINCFPGDTPVTSLGGVRKVFRRAYQGPLVTIKTKAGRQLRGSPNHPVLTKHGWVAIGSLNSGDDVLCHGFEVGNVAAENEPHREPLTLAQAFDLATETALLRRATSARQDFHGDGREGEIDVVTLEGELSLSDAAARGESFGQLNFAEADMRLSGVSCDGLLRQLVVAANHAAYGVMGFGDASQSGFGRHLSHADEVGFATIARGDAAKFERATNDTAVNATVSCEGEFAGAGQILFADQVDSCSVEDWSGQLYTLETETGAFVAGFVIVGNCRCGLVIRKPIPADRRAVRQ